MDFIIKKEHLNERNEYVGEIDVSNLDGNLIADGNLGYIKFKSINVSGFILFKAGSGINAGWGIKAGLGIEAGSGIKAGLGIEAGLSISAQTITTPLRIFAGLCLWRNPSEEEMKVMAKRIDGGGVIAFGEFEKIE